MSRFNLVREKWISVITENSGTTKEVSLLDIFENAEDYISIAGDSKAQDFAVLRILLAILHTVFSRYDFEGEAYEFIELDDNMIPISSIDLDNEVDYEDSLYETWQKLWGNGKFPVIVREYLEKWEEHFYLLDDKYPFLQVIEGDLTPDKISKSKASSFSGRNLNRLISESGNKIALFSPKYSDGINKDLLTFSEIARWTIALHGYIGLSDKVMFGKEKYKSSKGWLFDLGGIYIEGNNLFETLMLNLILVQEDYNYKNSIQMPAWEMNSEEVIRRHFNINNPDNISELYTRWSRAIYIDPEIDIGKPFNMSIVKLPDLDHCDYFLEPMTIWKYNRDGENKGKSTPRKHRLNQSLWRSFGLLTLSSKDNEDEKYRRPGVINWLNKQRKFIGNTNIKINMISMMDDSNATSWVPVDEIYDFINVNELVMTDLREEGWVPRIRDVVDETKRVVESIYKSLLLDIKDIRNLSSNDFVNQEVEKIYFLLDQPFRDWIVNIKPNDLKDEKVFIWRKILKDIVINQAKLLIDSSGPRDFIGIENEKEKSIKNIATAYNKFINRMNIAMK